jgi:hypothetical protein
MASKGGPFKMPNSKETPRWSAEEGVCKGPVSCSIQLLMPRKQRALLLMEHTNIIWMVQLLDARIWATAQ